MTDPRRDLPSVDRLLQTPPFLELCGRFPRARVVEGVRRELGRVRGLATASTSESSNRTTDAGHLAKAVEDALRAADQPSLRRVINATGVILHTNLGRAPLATVAHAAMQRVAAGYSNLEFDLDAGERGSRYVHCAEVLRELTGAHALVVNNNAAALVLALNTVALSKSVIVSRGELVEIGGAFRVPEILARSGARLVEVGSTNRTRLADYRAALDAETGAILKVHRSNFRMTGFVEEASLEELAGLAHEAGVPLLHDLGTGLLADAERLGLSGEMRVHDSLSAGADVVTFSGDKLLGGPQAGVALGGDTFIERMRSNPLCRALRVDKVTLAALEATLQLYRDPERALAEIPTLKMLAQPLTVLDARARALAAELDTHGVVAEIAEGTGRVGGGTCPEVDLPTSLLRLGDADGADALARRLRVGSPPVVVRVHEGRVCVDLRTVADEEVQGLRDALVQALLPN